MHFHLSVSEGTHGATVLVTKATNGQIDEDNRIVLQCHLYE